MEGHAIEKSSAKKRKREADNKKDVESNEENGEQQKRTRKEESHFLRLFTYVLNTIMAIKNVSDDDVSEMIPILINSFKPTQTFHEFHFNQWKNICAFLYRFASHGAGFARYRILNGERNCQVLESALRKSDLRVIFLGSGAGNDAVGLCSALSELQFPKSLKLFLVDKFKEWSLCNKLAKAFIEEEDFGKVSELFQNTNVELSFIRCDLPGGLESDRQYFEILGKADVIVMSKFLTSLDRKEDGKHERDIIKSLQEHMKEDAVIIINDKLVYLEDRWKGFTRKYEWSVKEEDNYMSTAFAEERFNSTDRISSKLPIYVIVKNST